MSPFSAPSNPLPERPGPAFTIGHLLLLSVVVLATVIGYRPDEFHFTSDETRHAVTGLFFRDALADRPLANAKQYVYEYYAKYPALGIPHWPPFYYFVEGLFFLLFGISLLSARLSILLFALLAAYFWQRIAAAQGPPHRAWFAALIFPLVPYIIVYQRSVMLEMPYLALALAAIYFWLRFLDTQRSLYVWLVAGFAALAFLTSQKALFLPVLVGLHFLMERKFRLLKRWDVWAALALAALFIVPWYLYTFRTLSLSYQRVIGESSEYLSVLPVLTYYLDRLPWQMGGVLFCLCIPGILWALARAPRQHRFFLLWVLSCYVTFTWVREKDLRHTMIWIPPLVYFSLLAVEALFARRRWALLACGGLAAWLFVGALQVDRSRRVGVEAAAQWVTSQQESDVLYYQGALNGNFIFWVRKYDPEKRRLVAREKQLVATQIVQGYGQREVLKTSDEILNFFRTWGIRYALVENREVIAELAPARRLFRSAHFELVKTFPVEDNFPVGVEGPQRRDGDLKILVYRYRGPIQRSPHGVSIPMLTLRSDIPIRLERLAGRPWPN